MDAEDLEDVKRRVFKRASEVRKNHPNEELEEVEIYELVRVATFDFRPRLVA